MTLSGFLLGTSNFVCSNGTITLLPNPSLFSVKAILKMTLHSCRHPGRNLGVLVPTSNPIPQNHQILLIYLPITFQNHLLLPTPLSTPQFRPVLTAEYAAIADLGSHLSLGPSHQPFTKLPECGPSAAAPLEHPIFGNVPDLEMWCSIHTTHDVTPQQDLR